MFALLISLSTTGFAQTDAWEFQDWNCREGLDLYAGTFPAHPAGHDREEETIIEEYQRTGNFDRLYQKVTGAVLGQVKDCLEVLSYSLGEDAQRRNNRLEDLEERQMRIEDKLDKILAILER